LAVAGIDGETKTSNNKTLSHIDITPLLADKENINESGVKDKTCVLNSSLNIPSNILQDKTNLIGLSELGNNSSIDKLILPNSSAQQNLKAKNTNSSCSPWEGCNPLVWCRSTDSMISRINSQRKAAVLIAQNNCPTLHNKSIEKPILVCSII